MKIIDLAFYSYPVTQLKRARAFYESALCLSPARCFGNEEHGAVEYDIGAATLCIANVFTCFAPACGGGMIVLEVADFAAALDRLLKLGTRVVLEPYESPLCRGVAISDPDGNSLMLHQRKAIVR